MTNDEQDKIIAGIAKRMADEIDREVLKTAGLPKFQLICDEGRVFGSRYYTVQPAGWAFYGDSIEWNDMVKWCVDTFGPTPDDGVWTPNSRWYVNNAKFWFRNKADQNWFTLRWS